MPRPGSEGEKAVKVFLIVFGILVVVPVSLFFLPMIFGRILSFFG